MTEEDNPAFDHAIKYHICDEMLGDDRVCDHCHIPGKYRGAAHNTCNFILYIFPYKSKVPAVFFIICVAITVI